MKQILGLLLGLILLGSSAQAELQVASIFGNGMVLQRNQAVPVWGQADPGSEVQVEIGSQRIKTKAGDDGRWQVKLTAQVEGGPLNLTVTSGSETKSFQDVWYGEVWLCSGQSNMEFFTRSTNRATEELAAANYPQIRLFHVLRNAPKEPAPSVKGTWEVCTPESVKEFSAVGYFFGRELNKTLKVPIGLIESSWGGTPAEAWTRWTTLDGVPDFQGLVETRRVALSPEGEVKRKESAAAVAEWEKNADQLQIKPTTPKPSWFQAAMNDPAWALMFVPGAWEKTLNLQLDGSVWFRQVVEIPEALTKAESELSLGTIDDFDLTWVNGKQVGKTGTETPKSLQVERHYKIPAGTWKAGANVIVVRVVDRGGSGGFTGNPESFGIKAADGSFISLVGTWQYQVETTLPPKPKAAPGFGSGSLAGVLYDGMIAPLVPYAIRGVIWYQGESNAGRAEQYRTLFPHMIKNWRADWGQGDFPFYYVQVANYMARKDDPADSGWAELREAQLMTLSLPKTGQAVAIDIGEAKDIHPRNKQEVGRRLALIALAQDYGQTVADGTLANLPWVGSYFRSQLVYSGPIYRRMKVDGSRVRLEFTQVGGGLVTQGGGELKGFAVAGEDKKFVWAQARIEGNRVIVESAPVPNPVAVRYAWADNPECNLSNREGLPASPFRTDNWPGVTAGKR